MKINDENEKSSLAKSMNYLSWGHIFRAMLVLFRENEANDHNVSDERKAGADNWALCDILRLEILRRARTLWAKFANEDEMWFPYSETAIAVLYLRIRKRDEKQIVKWEEQLGLRGAHQAQFFAKEDE